MKMFAKNRESHYPKCQLPSCRLHTDSHVMVALSYINILLYLQQYITAFSLGWNCVSVISHWNIIFFLQSIRFGLQFGDTNFIGGNRTRRKVTRLKRSLSKRNTPAPPSRTGHQSSRPTSSIKTPIPSQPIHIYTYRFWVSCEPWIEKLFKNPSDRRIESIGRVSDCHIRLTRRRRRNTQGFRQQMVSIVAPNAEALEKCCKLFDDKFPCFYATAGLILSHDQLKRLSKSSIQADGHRSKRDRCVSVSSVPMKTKNVAQYLASQMTTNMNEYSKLATYSHTRPYIFNDRISIFDWLQNILATVNK